MPACLPRGWASAWRWARSWQARWSPNRAASARVLHLVEPLRDMFAALFFVAIGLKIDPAMLLQYALPALLVALRGDRRQDAGLQPGRLRDGPRPAHGVADRAGHGADRRVLVRDRHAGAVAGRDQRLHLSDRGGGLGAVHGGVALSDRSADALGRWPAAADPALRCGCWRSATAAGSRTSSRSARTRRIAAIFRRLLWHIAINVLLVVTLFVIGAYVNSTQLDLVLHAGHRARPAPYADLGVRAVSVPADADRDLPQGRGAGHAAGRDRHTRTVGRSYTQAIRNVLARVIPLATLLALGLLVSALGSAILPPRGIALSLMVVGIVLAVVLWRSLVKMHARLQAALKETLDKPVPHD